MKEFMSNRYCIRIIEIKLELEYAGRFVVITSIMIGFAAAFLYSFDLFACCILASAMQKKTL